jgi:hypothetical protein
VLLQDEGEKYDAYVNEILKASDLDESLAQQVRAKHLLLNLRISFS